LQGTESFTSPGFDLQDREGQSQLERALSPADSNQQDVWYHPRHFNLITHKPVLIYPNFFVIAEEILRFRTVNAFQSKVLSTDQIPFVFILQVVKESEQVEYTL
jgi:hypothetical protein